MFTGGGLIRSRVHRLLNSFLLRRTSFSIQKLQFQVKFFFRCKMSPPVLKPPNILVYTGEDFNRGDPTFYRHVAKNIQFCLQSDCYTIYLLTPLQVVNDPWEENLKLLVISCDNLTDEVAESFRKYILNGGQILNFGANLKIPQISFKEGNTINALVSVDYRGSEISLHACKNLIEFSPAHDDPAANCLVSDGKGEPRIIEVAVENGSLIVSDVHLEIDPSILHCDKQSLDALNHFNDSRLGILRSLLSDHFGLSCSEETEKLDLTACYMLTKNKNDSQLFDNSPSNTFKKLGIKFLDYISQSSIPAATEKELPVVYNCPEKAIPTCFDAETYFSNLKTKSMGQRVFFVEVVGTTMAVVESLPEIEGAVVIADKQVLGKGRRGNRWITPKGSAAFSAHLSFPLKSPLGQKLPIIQYFAVLSLVKAIRETPGYENLDIRIKWPNDIYYEGQSKLGGVIVNSTITGNTVHIYTGSGLNVNNSKPTMCVNEGIRLHNLKTGDSLAAFTSEELIARSLNELEKLVLNYQDNNTEYFFSAYYKYWMHTGQKVSLSGKKGTVTIVGIDQYGFLVVETEHKKKIVLQPDGNSFDIMKNLIVVREM